MEVVVALCIWSGLGWRIDHIQYRNSNISKCVETVQTSPGLCTRERTHAHVYIALRLALDMVGLGIATRMVLISRS